MQATANSNTENDDVTCPITLELFRDPVLAKDGHVYEREAIVRWILQNGTSPFTREPLRIEDLQPNDHLRRLAARRRNSTVSYNARNNVVTLPPLRRMSRNNAHVAPALVNPVPRNRSLPQRLSSYIPLIICAVCSIGFLGLVIGLPVGLSYVRSSNSDSWSSGVVGGTYKAFSIDSLMFEAGVNDISFHYVLFYMPCHCQNSIYTRVQTIPCR